MFQHIVYSLANRQGLFVYVRTCKTRLWCNNQIQGCCNITVQSCYFIIPQQHVLSYMDGWWWFQQHCPSRLGVFVHQAMNSAWTSLSTTCMNKPVNNHVQAGQLNHIQASELNVDNWNHNCEAESEAKSPRPLRGLQVDFSLTRNVSYAVR